MYGNVFKIVTTFFENLIATYTYLYAQRSSTSCFLWCVLISFFDHVHSEDQHCDVRSKHSIANMFLLSIYHYCIILFSEFVFSLFSVNLFHFHNWIKSLKCKLFATVKKSSCRIAFKNIGLTFFYCLVSTSLIEVLLGEWYLLWWTDTVYMLFLC